MAERHHHFHWRLELKEPLVVLSQYENGLDSLQAYDFKGGTMSLKEKVDRMRQARKPGRFIISGFDTVDVINTLFTYIDSLESSSSEADSLRVKVGILEAKIEAGADGKFGTDDDKVTLSRAKKATAKKKAPAKKRAPAKKKTTAKKSS